MRRNVTSRSRKKEKQTPRDLKPIIQEEATSFVSVNAGCHWTEDASANVSASSFNRTQHDFHRWLSGSNEFLHRYCQGTITASSIAEDATPSSSNPISTSTSSIPSQYQHLPVPDDVVYSSQQDNSFKESANVLDLETIGIASIPIEEDYSADSASSNNWVQKHEEALLKYSQSIVQAMADSTNPSPLVLDECEPFEAEKLPFRRDVGLEVIDTFTKDDIWDLLS